MFLNLLTEKEKMSFLDLLHITASIDGDYTETEKEKINAYAVEMAIKLEDIKSNETNLEKVLLNFYNSNDTIKKVVVLELIALALVDGYKDEEKKIIEEILTKFNLQDNEYGEKAVRWLEKILPMYREGYEIVGLI
jgi:hypothetical protein